MDTFFHEIISILHNSERIHILQPSDEDILHSIILPYFRGLSTPKGISLIENYFENQKEKQ